ncbi:MAG: methylmalonyl-CoA mutase [Flavobacteriaceae bacterium CG_4_10_14_3_um_filter_33_47]|nr:MAG: methylmalonyl-CoA mutase [Flavobacteriaceae bacterium CG_4_10_14_3_um_filter_33_47]PJB19593.1 MAG: methylmalonyl-CoA mutase [Flavobacteriaceae bacterium CG_4_9_14_3_um_filter_33_16]
MTNLFDEFDSVTSKQWKQNIQFELKGADYNKTLIWKTQEDIDVKPFYHADEFKEISFSSNTSVTSWNICQTIFVFDEIKSNKKALSALDKGAESIKFIIPNNTVSIEKLIKNLDLERTKIYFELQYASHNFTDQFASILNKKNSDIHLDIIANLARNGNWFNTLKDDHTKFEAFVNQTNSFSIDMSLYQNAGATMVQQLAYGLAHANEYLNYFNNILSQEKKQSMLVTFNVAIGTHYFFEIAKLKALRKLWETLASEYGFNLNCQILAYPTKRNKTLYDYNINMLRTTTECMSAILGGANTINNLPYDAIYHKDNEFGERMARNQLLILKHESYFDKVKNPSDGAYYIATITKQLSEKSLELFKNIEANGGFLKQLKEGIIQRKIKESANKEQKMFDEGTEILLGCNKHQNPDDKMKHELELYPFVKTNQRKTLIEPIIEKRLAETLEQQRLKNED